MFTVKKKIHSSGTVQQKVFDILLHLHFSTVTTYIYIYICYISLFLEMLQNNHLPLLDFVREYCIKCLSPDHQTAKVLGGSPVVRDNT